MVEMTISESDNVDSEAPRLERQGLRILDLNIADNWFYCRFSRKRTTVLPPQILVFCDDEEIGAVDTTALHFWKSGTTEFSLWVPMKWNDGVGHSLTLKASDTRERLTAVGVDVVVHQSSMRSHIEQLNGEAVTGWVYAPDLVVGDTVELFDRDRLISVQPLSNVRKDVDDFYGVTGARGFAFLLPLEVFDGRAHDFRLFWRGQRLANKTARSLVLKLGGEDLPTAERRYRGQVAEVSAKGVRGHAIDLQKDTPVSLEVMVDGALIATVIADAYVPSLRDPAHSGFHGFGCQFPSSLMNGRRRTVEVRVGGTDYALPSSVNAVVFPLVACPPDPVGLAAWRPQPASFSSSVPVANLASPAILSLIVLNLDGAFLLRSLLTSVSAIQFRDDLEIIVVDHGSTDETESVLKAFSDTLNIRIERRGANYSYSESNNYAASLATGEYLVFCNNDVVFVEDCLSRMRAALDASESIGLVGAKLLEPVYRGDGRWDLRPHHTGVAFDVGSPPFGRRPIIYYPVELTETPSDQPSGLVERAAVTAALAMMKKADFLALEGFDEGYRYGYEDVDLALRLRQRLGLGAVCALDAVAIHNRSATRERKVDVARDKIASLHNDRTALANRELFYRRFSRFLPRQILGELIHGRTTSRTRPLRVVFAVTEAHMSTAAGDYFTALELGLAMRREFGWEVMFIQNGHFDVQGVDVLIAMRHDYDLGKIANANPGLVTVAWMRNRIDQWTQSPHFEKYHLLFASSLKAIGAIADLTGRTARLLSIAANAERFGRGQARQELATDVAFTGHYWGADREAVDVLQPLKIPHKFAIWGKNWGDHPVWSRFWRGWASYSDMPDIYASSKLVIDDSHPVTREWNSLNSRVFDVLASGRLVLTNCEGGAEELFGGRLPSFSTQAELHELIDRYMENPDERERLASELQAEVLEHHTYSRRAHAFRDALDEWVSDRGLRIAIKSPVPDHETKHQWGDHHFALALKRALERLGHHVRIDILPEWHCGLSVADEVVIVLRGLSRYEPSPGAINLMWLLSHPDEVSIAEMKAYDHVFIASEPMAKRLAPRLGPRVSALLQCTDPLLFHPSEEPESHRVLFVGNSRAAHRRMVRWAVEADLEGLAVYGAGWTGLVPERLRPGEHIANEQLYRYYSGAGVVLNDHWPDMAEEGFLSNRLFDAAACGATIVTDPAAGLQNVFGDLVRVCSSKARLTRCIEEALASEDRGERGRRLQEFVLGRHTFDHRAQTIMDVVARVMMEDSGWRPASQPLPTKSADAPMPA
jgi:GT2 family glycosyltransferase/spore maturation protein CgeB